MSWLGERRLHRQEQGPEVTVIQGNIPRITRRGLLFREGPKAVVRGLAVWKAAELAVSATQIDPLATFGNKAKDKLKEVAGADSEVTVPNVEILRGALELKGNVNVCRRSYLVKIEDLKKQYSLRGRTFPAWMVGEVVDGVVQMWAQTECDFSKLTEEDFTVDVINKTLHVDIPRLRVGAVGIYDPNDPDAPKDLKGPVTDYDHTPGVLNGLGNMPDLIEEPEVNGMLKNALKVVAPSDQEFMDESIRRGREAFENYTTAVARVLGHTDWAVTASFKAVDSSPYPEIALGKTARVKLVMPTENGKKPKEQTINLRLDTNGKPYATNVLKELVSPKQVLIPRPVL